jgi:hypothetical protein
MFLHSEPARIFVRQFVAVPQEIMVKGCSRVAPTHNSRVQIDIEFTQDPKKIRL